MTIEKWHAVNLSFAPAQAEIFAEKRPESVEDELLIGERHLGPDARVIGSDVAVDLGRRKIDQRLGIGNQIVDHQ